MRFCCQTAELLEGLNIVTHVLSSKTTQPILECVLIRSVDDRVRLTCSDGMISASTLIDARIEEDGALVLPGRLFLDAVRHMPNGELSFHSNAAYAALLRCEGARLTIAGQAGDNYPALPLVSAENVLTLPQALLREMLAQTAFAIAVDDQRKVLNGAYLEVFAGEMRVVALDGFRMALRLTRISAPDMRAIIPGRAVSEMIKMLTGDEEAMADLLIGGSQMQLKLGDTQFYTTLIEGEYINYRLILPGSFKTTLAFTKGMLTPCVDRASLIARDSKTNLIKLDIQEDRVIVSSNAETGEAYEEIEAEIEGDPLPIAFNVQYMSDVLRVMPDTEAIMCFNTAVSPCLIKPKSGDSFVYMMLPVRVSA